jgi:DNA-binding MarR family transcriptional regulator
VSESATKSKTSATGLARELQAMWLVVHQTSSGEFFRTVDELGLSLTELKMLSRLDDGLHRTVKVLGDELKLSLPSASRAVDALVRRGLLVRYECAEDRRQKQVHLSPEGADAVRRLTEARLAGLAEFVETLDEDERAALSRALAPIVERIDSET